MNYSNNNNNQNNNQSNSYYNDYHDNNQINNNYQNSNYNNKTKNNYYSNSNQMNNYQSNNNSTNNNYYSNSNQINNYQNNNNSTNNNNNNFPDKNMGFQDKLESAFKDVKDTSNEYSKEDIKKGKTLGILSYLGILVLIPYLSEKKNKYVIFHAKQGISLLIAEIIVGGILWFLGLILSWRVSWLVSICQTAFFFLSLVLSFMGIKNVCDGKAKELPLINKMHS